MKERIITKGAYMSEENVKPSPDYNQDFARINNLLHELETELTDEQHSLLTRLFSERAVLSAMRAFKNEEIKPGSDAQ
jgi:hypothetical protein